MIKHARFVILYRNLTDDGATAAFPSPHKAHSIFISYIYRTRKKLAYGRQGLAGRIGRPGYSSSGYFLGCAQRLS